VADVAIGAAEVKRYSLPKEVIELSDLASPPEGAIVVGSEPNV
jgi:hypothetical protein